MSDCWSQYVAHIPFYTQEQLDWLEREMESSEELEAAREENTYGIDPNDDWYFPSCEYESLPDGQTGGMLIMEGEYGEANIAFLVAVYARKFGLFDDHSWVLQVSYGGQPSQPDLFGGCAYCVHKGRVFFTGTWPAVEDWCVEQDQADQIVNAWQAAF